MYLFITVCDKNANRVTFIESECWLCTKAHGTYGQFYFIPSHPLSSNPISSHLFPSHLLLYFHISRKPNLKEDFFLNTIEPVLIHIYINISRCGTRTSTCLSYSSTSPACSWSLSLHLRGRRFWKSEFSLPTCVFTHRSCIAKSVVVSSTAVCKQAVSSSTCSLVLNKVGCAKHFYARRFCLPGTETWGWWWDVRSSACGRT